MKIEIKLNSKLPKCLTEVFGSRGLEIDTEKVKEILSKNGIPTFAPNLGGLIALIEYLNLPNKDYLIDMLVGDEPDEEVQKTINELSNEWVKVTLIDSENYRTTLRVNKNNITQILKIFNEQ